MLQRHTRLQYKMARNPRFLEKCLHVAKVTSQNVKIAVQFWYQGALTDKFSIISLRCLTTKAAKKIITSVFHFGYIIFCFISANFMPLQYSQYLLFIFAYKHTFYL